jgi:hypothetical protein
MADKTTNQETALTNPDGTEIVRASVSPYNSGSTNRKITFANLKAWILSAFNLQAVTTVGATTDQTMTVTGAAGAQPTATVSKSQIRSGDNGTQLESTLNSNGEVRSTDNGNSTFVKLKPDGSATFQGTGANKVEIDPVAGVSTNNINNVSGQLNITATGAAIVLNGDELNMTSVGGTVAIASAGNLNLTVASDLFIDGNPGQTSGTTIIDAAFFSGGGSLAFVKGILTVINP